MSTHFRLLPRLEISRARGQGSTTHVLKASTGQNYVFAITFSLAMIITVDCLDSHSCGCHVSVNLMTQKATGVLGEGKEG